MGTHPIFESDFDCLTACTAQRSFVRFMTLLVLISALTKLLNCWSKGLLVNKVLSMLKDHLRTEQMLLVELPQRKEVKLTLTFQFLTRLEKQQMLFNRMPL